MSDTAGEPNGDELVELEGADLGEGLESTDAVAKPAVGPHAHVAEMALAQLTKMTAMSHPQLLAQIPELGSENALIKCLSGGRGI